MKDRDIEETKGLSREARVGDEKHEKSVEKKD